MNGTQSIYKDTHMSAQARVHRKKHALCKYTGLIFIYLMRRNLEASGAVQDKYCWLTS